MRWTILTGGLIALGVVTSPASSQHVLAEERGAIDPGSEHCGVCHVSHTGRASGRSSFVLRVDGERVARLNRGDPSRGTGVVTQSCLRCHSTAERRSRQPEISATERRTSGGGLLGSDLTDDHPIGTVDPSSARPQLFAAPGRAVESASSVRPSLVPQASGETEWVLECTTCHDPHDVVEGSKSAEEWQIGCLECHEPSVYSVDGHSSIGCSRCHALHGGQRGLSLLRTASVEGLCGACHAGTAAPANIRMETEIVPAIPGHLEPVQEPCEECHQVH